MDDKGDKHTFAFFLDVRKAYDTAWCNGVWYKLWGMGVTGNMWRVIIMYEGSKSIVLLDGKKSEGPGLM